MRERGSFNKKVLLSTKFTDTELFSPAATTKKRFGKYCDAPYNSRKYNDFWKEEKRRCLEGYVNPKTGVKITGYHYFFLNYKNLQILTDTTGTVSDRVEDFPRFWAIHYHWFWAVEEAKKAGKHLCLLKPRGTGFSEIFSSMGARDYTFRVKRKAFYFVSNEGYLNKDGILTKAWDNLEFLNSETERAFRHLRQRKNQDLHKRASKIDPRTGNEKYTGGEIIGRVIDDIDKVRGARGDVYLEEGGSFPKVDDAWNIMRPLTEQGGIAWATIILWGTGGEQGAGIQGLDDIFRNPEGYNCLPFESCWEEEAVGKDHGFFFPTWACMDKFMDRDGNPDFEAGKLFHEKEREKIRKHSPQKEDKYIAEYPFTPNEALIRLSFNHFPIAELQRQLNYLETSKEVGGFLKYGWLEQTKEGVQFNLDVKAKPINKYPHKDGDDTTGCITILESPLKDKLGHVPDNLYQIIVDPYYKDEAEHSTSLGAAYVYKKTNTLFPTEDDMLVAWYVARPKTTSIFHRNLFLLAKYYNAKIQSEIAGGGKGILDYAKVKNLLHYCDFEPTMFTSTKEIIKISNRNYFINMPTERKKQALQDLADWLLTERSLQVGDGEETEYVLNLHKIYDKALLEELIKYSDTGNFDRISALLVLMVVREEINTRELKDIQEARSTFFSRPFFTDRLINHDDKIPVRDLLAGSNMEKLSRGEKII